MSRFPIILTTHEGQEMLQKSQLPADSMTAKTVNQKITQKITLRILVKVYSPLEEIHLWLKPCPPARESITVGAGKCSFLVCFVFLTAHVCLSQHMSGYLNTQVHTAVGWSERHWTALRTPLAGDLIVPRKSSTGQKHTEHRLSTEPEELPPTPHHLEEQSVQAESGHKENPPKRESLQRDLWRL